MQIRWLFSKGMDLGGLFLPVWVTWCVCFLLPSNWLQSEIPLMLWVLIVIGIDVGHVWSTLFRSYFSPIDRSMHYKSLWLIPIMAFIVFFGISQLSIVYFWRVLAYLALYHFIKQQYGFLRLYKAKGHDFQRKFIPDNFIIYFSMLVPVLFWHLQESRQFSWFIDGDFYTVGAFLKSFDPSSIKFSFSFIYFSIIICWLIEDVIRQQKSKISKLPKQLWIITTALNWYIGIVYFNSDLAFTLTNVIAHGIPYYILIFTFIRKRSFQRRGTPYITKNKMVWMVGAVIVIGFFEEYLWDMLVYRDHEDFFSNIITYTVDQFSNPLVVGLAMSILVVPQITHYILDGIIWKTGPKNPGLKEIMLNNE